ncbi:MAG: hypothetical protein ACRD8A_10220 [Candidatus Acidiferrales bacterium]
MVACLVVLAVGCIGSEVAQAVGPQIGHEKGVPVHLRDGEEQQMPLRKLIAFGESLFVARFTSEDGLGRPQTKGTGEPLSDPSSPLVFPRNSNRISGPESQSCAACHNLPRAGGGGDRVGDVFVMAQLPGTGYTPEISLANFSSKTRRITVTYATTSANAPSSQKLRTVVLPAGTSKNVSFGKLRGDPTIQNSFVVSSDGTPGDVLAKLVSKSDDGIRELELMGKDEMDTDNGGNHPWSIKDGADATLLLFNPTNSAQYFNVILSGGGITWYKAYHLQPMQTESIGIRELIQNRVKDDKGNTLPVNAQEGQVDWYVPARNAGRGRILETNKAALMARNFSCGGQIMICSATFGQLYSYVGDDDKPIQYAQVYTSVCMNQCNGTVLGQGGSGLAYSWSVSGAPQIYGSNANQTVWLEATTVGSGTAYSEVTDAYCEVGTQGPAPAKIPATLVMNPSSRTCSASKTGGTCNFQPSIQVGPTPQDYQSITFTVFFLSPSNPGGVQLASGGSGASSTCTASGLGTCSPAYPPNSGHPFVVQTTGNNPNAGTLTYSVFASTNDQNVAISSDPSPMTVTATFQ